MKADDPRVRRTRARLRTAVLTLAAEKDVGAITVSEVARCAGVNRATVYLHFPDVDALVTDAMEEAVTQVARAAALCPRDAPRDRTPEPLTVLFGHVAAAAPLYRRMLGPQGSALFATRMRDRLTAELAGRLTGAGPAGEAPGRLGDVPAETHAAYLAGALIGVIAHWVTGDPPAPAEEVALAFWRLFRA
ncbi:TetR/AcrR family transcriptional regulator [Streptosporangium pseudovulgare]|uniref:HTH tetR-type domain-containing protein n=1 Tax=Streptosporangium pseudovulgare TaxID=35765 RepID=A0ABQ2R0R9_9ACTN|nr:TetR/AcrR family transcriptional regulator [Streptosporangium pseudovulgare]GGQ04276.1 hypothetical protein GCM10010140_37950 [Streptosporangium pseudovulgare]